MILKTQNCMLFFRCINHPALKLVLAGSWLIAFAIILAFAAICIGLNSNVHAQSVVKKQSNLLADDTAPASKAHLTGFHVVGTDETVRLVLDVNKIVVAESIMLSAPYRLVIDLPETEFRFKTRRSSGSPGFLTKVNFGTTDDNTSRLVIETSVPFVIEKQFSVSEKNGQTRRLVIDLAKTSETIFRIAVARQAEERRLAIAQEKRRQEAFTQTDKNEQAAAPKGDIAKPLSKKRIVIDPGHGGKDGGAKTVAGILEKDIVLSFSKKLAQNLEATGKFEVTLTRVGDDFVRLNERVRIAREQKADLFVSIHADSFPDDRSVRGTAVYTISERASDAMAARIADQQNKSDAIAGHDIINGPDEVVDILFDLTRRETSNLSIVFARHFFSSMQAQIRFFKKPLQRAAFTVLRVPDIPSVLIELGFLSNARDAELLSSDEWREESAQKMAITIAEYFNKPVIGLSGQ